MAPRPKHSPQSRAEQDALDRAVRQMGTVLLYRITSNGLGKDNIYVRKRNFADLASMGIHDFLADPTGGGTTRPMILVSPSGSTSVTQARWYTVANNRNDARFRVTGLQRIIEPGELLAVGVDEDVVTALNLSRPMGSAEALASLAEDVPLEASEGRMVQRLHRARERDRSIVDAKKNAARSANGALTCEACGFAPALRFEAASERAIEAHHLSPLASLPTDGGFTRMDDLALLCATCHRLVHALDLSVDELRELNATDA